MRRSVYLRQRHPGASYAGNSTAGDGRRREKNSRSTFPGASHQDAHSIVKNNIKRRNLMSSSTLALASDVLPAVGSHCNFQALRSPRIQLCSHPQLAHQQISGQTEVADCSSYGKEL